MLDFLRNARQSETIMKDEPPIRARGVSSTRIESERNRMLPHRNPPPEKLSERDTSSVLTTAARKMEQALGLKPPRSDDPGYWKTPDNFISISAGLLKYTYKSIEDTFRVLISFEPRYVEKLQKAIFDRELPDYDQLPQEERRNLWGRVLRLRKQARAERINHILDELEEAGVPVARGSIEVHRVSHTFYAEIDLRTLYRINKLQRDHGFKEFRRILIDDRPTAN